jgi:transposase InsO family protein
MSYTTNPHLPRVRRDAVRLVKYRGWSLRKTARHVGVQPSTILRWCAKDVTGGWQIIPTQSSRPLSHPATLSDEIVSRILAMRAERRQCAEILHHRLAQEGVQISLSSVKRTLKRWDISKYSQWKKWHQYPARSLPAKPGFLVEIDAVHEGIPSERLSAYALIDVCSRWGYAQPVLRVNSRQTRRFLCGAKAIAPFPFRTIQTDHGSEFSRWFTKMTVHDGMSHRHTRVRTPTDNGHVERFIRSLQDECLHRIPRDFRVWQREIPEWIDYYNTERPHMGLNFQTPLEVLRSY